MSTTEKTRYFFSSGIQSVIPEKIVYFLLVILSKINNKQKKRSDLWQERLSIFLVVIFKIAVDSRRSGPAGLLNYNLRFWQSHKILNSCMYLPKSRHSCMQVVVFHSLYSLSKYKPVLAIFSYIKNVSGNGNKIWQEKFQMLFEQNISSNVTRNVL